MNQAPDGAARPGRARAARQRRRDLSATGALSPRGQAKLVFTGTGQIKDILVSVGDQVTAGQAAGAAGQ